jgi:hypothetical protein
MWVIDDDGNDDDEDPDINKLKESYLIEQIHLKHGDGVKLFLFTGEN